ncbi:MAG: carbamoyltransferase HypF, partial [Proteobacteria bacterium]|nr:carbamoyltransferase HypF [Pseudomonadota bacterium]
NSPLTSSAGRLFDGISSLLGICHTITHESQAAMELEAAVDGDAGNGQAYAFDLIETRKQEHPYYRIDAMPCVRKIVRDLIEKKNLGEIAMGFHKGLVTAFVKAASKVGGDTGIRKAVLSGGVFNNNLVLNQTISELEKKGFTVYTHSLVPTGDGGICLGQVLAAAAQNQPLAGALP